MEKHASKEEKVDKKYGVYKKGDQYYMGNRPIEIKGDDIIVDYITYKGTEGLWDLIMSKEPKVWEVDDSDNYGMLLFDTNAIFKDYKENNINPNSSREKKWTDTVKNYWDNKKYYIQKLNNKYEEIKEELIKQEEDDNDDDEEDDKFKEAPESSKVTEKSGKGLPKDPNLLIEKLDLLMESKKAGNTGVRNELISICNELKKQKILNAKQHKNILKKC